MYSFTLVCGLCTYYLFEFADYNLEVCSGDACYATDKVAVTVTSKSFLIVTSSPCSCIVPDLVPSHTDTEVFNEGTLALSCTPSQGEYEITWALNGSEIYGYECGVDVAKRNVFLSSCFYPTGYNTHLFVSYVSDADAGVYSCSLVYNGTVYVSRNISVIVSDRKSLFVPYLSCIHVFLFIPL